MDSTQDKSPRPYLNVEQSGREGQAPSGFRIERSPGIGYIRVIGRGFWTLEEIERHFDELRDIISKARQVRPEVRVLVDLRESGAQLPEAVNRVSARVQQIYQEGDRVAIVLASSLAKLQMRRAIKDLQHEMFVSPHAAEQWLMAYN